jgi:predicted flap endonuclease-1-like 5' DNA nuclease
MAPKSRTSSSKGVAKAKAAPSGGYKCPVSSPEFLKHAVPYKFKLILEPKQFSTGGFGWTKYLVEPIEADGPKSKALNDKVVLANTTCNANVLMKQAKSVCSLTSKQFLKAAKKWPIDIVAEAYEFSTGSVGWEAHMRSSKKVCGEELQVQVNLNAVVRGSKPKAPPDDSSDPVLKNLGPHVLSKAAWGRVGKATSKDKDDLKEIKGIGPFIEKRLNKIELYTFEQISKMTPKIETGVTKAIVYFPGRHRRDNWTGQAKEFFAKKQKRQAKGLVKKPSFTKGPVKKGSFAKRAGQKKASLRKRSGK